MDSHPAQHPPETPFAHALRAEPASDPGLESFRLSLFAGETQLGWLGKNAHGWAILVTDRESSLVLERFPYEGVDYYRIKGSGEYLSVSTRAYVGFYNWLGARGWTWRGSELVSDYNGQKLSLYSKEDAYLYAWDDYSALNVKRESSDGPVVTDPPLTSAIEHVIVLMFENRSFDNLLGGLYPERTKCGEYDGLLGTESNPIDPKDPSKGTVTVFQRGGSEGAEIMPYPDPGELFVDMTSQIFAGGDDSSMQGFAANYAEQKGAPLREGGPIVEPDPANIMHYYSAETAPASFHLAQQYAVCDTWFASGPVQTLSNRMFAQCGTPGVIPGTRKARVNNPDFLEGVDLDPFKFSPPVKDRTIFELLDEAYPGEVNWKVYYHDAPISALSDYVWKHWDMFSWDSGNVWHYEQRLDPSESNLEYDIKHHRLPKYSFIEPRYTNTFGGVANSNHPGGAGIDFKDPNGNSLPPPISLMDGERFLLEVYNTLRKYPETFEKTLLVVTYDEHGGCFDHVGPPAATSPFREPVENFSYNRYGVRVPAILIHPSIRPGTVYRGAAADESRQHFDHTSLISTLCAQFGLPGSLTPRVEAAPVLADLIASGGEAFGRPEPPVIPEADLDAAAAAVLGSSPQSPSSAGSGTSHSLAGVLRPLLARESDRLSKGRP